MHLATPPGRFSSSRIGRDPQNRWSHLGTAAGGQGARGQLQARLPTPGFHGYLRTTLWGSEAGAVVQRLGWGTWGLDGLAAPAGPVPGSRARGGARPGAAGEKQEGVPPASQPSPPLPAPCPAEAGRAGGRRAAWPVRGSGRGPDAGRATPIGHALCPQASWPCCAVQAAGPQVWDHPLSSLRAGREVTAGRSRASPSGHWGGRREAVSS